MSETANLDGLMEQELQDVRTVCDKLDGGRKKLAEFLNIRPAEVSRYLAAGARKPSGPILAGMQAFVKRHAELLTKRRRKQKAVAA